MNRSSRKRRNEKGFTIVELLIVIVVIAILAGLVIVSYNGITKQAGDAALVADLRNTRVAIENARTENGMLPSDIRKLGLTSTSSGNHLLYLKMGDGYCAAIRSSSTASTYHVTGRDSSIQEGDCRAAVTASIVATGWFAAQGLAADGVGNTYLGYAHRIGRMAPTGGPMTTLAGSGVAGYADGNGTAAQFNTPDTSFAVAGDGTVYVADRLNHCIRKVAPNGDVTTLAGLCGPGNSGMVYGVGTAARFNQPYGIALDASGNVYVADFGNNRIRKIDGSGLATTFAGTTGGFADGAALTTARFNRPTDVDVDRDGTVYVADSSNTRIRKITPSGDVTTFAGSGASGFLEALGTSAQFNYPASLAVDASGNVYVADRSNHRIRVINPQGYAMTLAGDGTAASTNGTGAAIRFSQPIGIAIDRSGILYTIEWATSGVRKISL